MDGWAAEEELLRSVGGRGHTRLWCRRRVFYFESVGSATADETTFDWPVQAYATLQVNVSLHLTSFAGPKDFFAVCRLCCYAMPWTAAAG